jgi:hypothetical protein
MADKHTAEERAVYQIRVRGLLDDHWSEWFSGLAIVVGEGVENPPITTLTGSVDQAALRGILNRLWDLNLALISVAPVGASPQPTRRET